MTTKNQHMDICKCLFGTLNKKEVEICKEIFGGQIVIHRDMVNEKPEKYYVTNWTRDKINSEKKFLKTMKSLCDGDL